MPTPASTSFFARLSAEVLSSSISFDSKYGKTVVGTKGSGTEITLASLPFGQGRAATERKAAVEYSDPSVAKRIFIPFLCNPVSRFGQGLTISIEQLDWRRTDCAVLPRNKRVTMFRSLAPSIT